MPDSAIHPLAGDRYALEGKITTMDAERTVLERGMIYIQDGAIQAVQPESAFPPAGFETAPVVRTGGTIYPGLIELHNHLSYDILPLWNVPQQFQRNEQWRNHRDKQKRITGPMSVLGRTPGCVEAIVRFVECKCLISGVTTSQGLSLYGVGIDPHYQGIVRNVEAPLDPALPRALTRIAEVEAAEVSSFFDRLQSTGCLLLHLCEGIDDRTRQQFDALQLPGGGWAITEALVGIHSAALTPQQFQILSQNKGAMVWSPLSNLLLYGQTADIQAARDAGVLMAIGSDWSPSGSKNLLCELKVAHLVSEAMGGVFSMEELVAMATCNPAKILKWDHALGSIEAGKCADLVVVDDRWGDPYQRLLNARESSISLVLIDGVPRFGRKSLMERFGPGTERIRIRAAERLLNLNDPSGDSITGALTLQAAVDRLEDGMGRLPELARALEDPDNPIAWLADTGMTFETAGQAFAALTGIAQAAGSPELTRRLDPRLFARPIAFLKLDLDDFEEESRGPHPGHPVTGQPDGSPAPAGARLPYSELLQDVQIDLDGLTVVDDRCYFSRLASQINLPDYVKTGLPRAYGLEPALPIRLDQ